MQNNVIAFRQPRRRAVTQPPSPLMLSDRLLTLAQDAERARCLDVARLLVALAHVVLEPQAVSHAML